MPAKPGFSLRGVQSHDPILEADDDSEADFEGEWLKAMLGLSPVAAPTAETSPVRERPRAARSSGEDRGERHDPLSEVVQEAVAATYEAVVRGGLPAMMLIKDALGRALGESQGEGYAVRIVIRKAR